MTKNKKIKTEPYYPTDIEVRSLLRMTCAYWGELNGNDREHLRGIATRELRRLRKVEK
jgi:hypothetical protein